MRRSLAVMLIAMTALYAYFGSGSVRAEEETAQRDVLQAEVFEKYKDYVAGVEITRTTEDDDGEETVEVIWTPGIRISDNRVLCSAALFPEDPVENTTYRVQSGNVRSRARLNAMNLRANVALVEIVTGSSSPMGFSNDEELKPGQKLYVMSVLPPSGKFRPRVAPCHITSAVELPAGTVYTTDLILPSLDNPTYVGAPVISEKKNVVGFLNVARGDDTNTLILYPCKYARSAISLAMDPRDTSLRRCWFGAFTKELTPEWRKKLGYPGNLQGSIIEDIIPDSPADKAGLKSLDVVYAINGLPLAGADAVNLGGYFSQNFRPNTEVMLSVYRDGERIELKVKLEESPETIMEAERYELPDTGLTVANLTHDMRIRFGLPITETGIYVYSWYDNKPFMVAVGNTLGVNYNPRNGMLIKKVEGKEIANVKEFEAAVKEARDDHGFATFFVRFNKQDEQGCINTAFVRVKFE
ncbi:MAG: PDZ domain-containing protein [Planctomycetota bacterium]|nr:PDZ domain-containing protein [Planctomycetota bacterium]